VRGGDRWRECPGQLVPPRTLSRIVSHRPGAPHRLNECCDDRHADTPCIALVSPPSSGPQGASMEWRRRRTAVASD